MLKGLVVWFTNRFVHLFSVDIKVDDHAEASYALVESPTFHDSYIETNHKVRLEHIP